MADIAALNIAVDTSGPKAATEALDRMAASAKPAADAVSRLEQASTRSAAGMQTIRAAADQASQAVARYVDIQKRIDAVTGVSGGGMASRAADIAAYGNELDRLRAKYNPLFAAGQQYKSTLAEISTAYRTGAISAGEHASAIQRTKAGFAAQVDSIKLSTASIGLNKAAWTNLGYQMNDIVSGIAMGQSPFTIMTQQGGQVLQVLQSGNGGVIGALKGIGSSISSILTPARLVGGTLVGVAVTGAAAWAEWQNKIDGLTRSLNGAGAAGGMTAGTLAKIAMTRGGNLSVSESFAAAGSYGGAGISAPMTGAMLGSTNRFSNAFVGLDKSAAIDELTRAFADPAKGAQELGKRFGVFGFEVEQQIRRAQALGDLEGARAILFREYDAALKKTTDTTSAFGKALQAASNFPSLFFNRLGRDLSAPTALESLERGLKSQNIHTQTADIRPYGAKAMAARIIGTPAADLTSDTGLWAKAMEDAAPAVRKAIEAENLRLSYIKAANDAIVRDGNNAAAGIMARTAANALP